MGVLVDCQSETASRRSAELFTTWTVGVFYRKGRFMGLSQVVYCHVPLSMRIP